MTTNDKDLITFINQMPECQHKIGQKSNQVNILPNILPCQGGAVEIFRQKNTTDYLDDVLPCLTHPKSILVRGCG